MRQLDLDRIRAEGYGFQIEMTYRAKQHGAAITEVPISFVDRAAGESKMSSVIVIEALGLVTWWGLGRLARGLRRALAATRGQGTAPSPGPGGTGSSVADGVRTANVAGAPGTDAGAVDPVRSR